MSKLLPLTVLALALATGCAKVPQAPVATASAASAVDPSDESRTLCLAEPIGQSPVDAAVRAAQADTRKFATRADRWVASGRQWVRKARLSSDPGFYLNVDGCATQALAVEPGLIAALELRGLVLMNDHRFEAARVLAEEILARDPDSTTASGTLSDALLELGRYDEAALAAQRQMSARPSMAAHARGSYLRWIRGDARSAKLFIRQALVGRDAADPEPTAWVLAEAATIYWHEADYNGADALYTEALKWVPDFPAALSGRGRIALAQGQPEAAIRFLEQSQRIHPLVETAWLLGDAYAMHGDSDRARQSYDEAVRQGRRGDKYTLALFYATKNRDNDEALRMLDDERRSRGGVYVDDAYAWALFRAGRMEQARQASERALRLGTRDARLLYHAGAIGLAAGEGESARKLIAEALALNPHFDLSGAAEARELLDASPMKVAAK